MSYALHSFAIWDDPKDIKKLVDELKADNSQDPRCIEHLHRLEKLLQESIKFHANNT